MAPMLSEYYNQQILAFYQKFVLIKAMHMEIDVNTIAPKLRHTFP